MKHIRREPQQGFFPQPVYLIGTSSFTKEPNFAPVTWLTACSGEPPLLVISMTKRMKTADNICWNGHFSANLVTRDMRGLADKCGAISGNDGNKCEKLGLRYSINEKLEIPVLEDSPWVFECDVRKSIALEETYMFIADVCSILTPDTPEPVAYGELDLRTFDPLIYSPSRYYSLGEFLGEVQA